MVVRIFPRFYDLEPFIGRAARIQPAGVHRTGDPVDTGLDYLRAGAKVAESEDEGTGQGDESGEERGDVGGAGTDEDSHSQYFNANRGGRQRDSVSPSSQTAGAGPSIAARPARRSILSVDPTAKRPLTSSSPGHERSSASENRG